MELGRRCQLSLSFAGLIAPEVVSDSRVGFVGGHTKYVLCQYDPAGGHYDLDCEENIGPDFYVQPGAGIEYDFAEKLSLHFEGRWRYSHGKREWVNNGVFGIGVSYRF